MRQIEQARQDKRAAIPLYLPLREGDNELLLAVTEESEDLGGWGVQARLEDLAGITFKD